MNLAPGLAAHAPRISLRSRKPFLAPTYSVTPERGWSFAQRQNLGKSLPPRRMFRLPSEIALCLSVRTSARFGHHRDDVLARGDPGQPFRDVPGRPCAEHRGEYRQPVADGRRLVVDDIVNAGCPALDGDCGRRCRVVDMQE